MITPIFSTLFTITILSTTTTNAAPVASVTQRSADVCDIGRTYYAAGQCTSGFVGCAPPDSDRICNTKEIIQNGRGDCGPEAFNLGQWFECANGGYTGCNTLMDICERVDTSKTNNNNNTPSPTPTKSCPTETPAAATPTATTTPIDFHKTTGFQCPQGTHYFPDGMCPSGFIGCHANGGEVCPGEKRFWSDCPAGAGFWTRCANGFLGCTTNTNICG